MSKLWFRYASMNSGKTSSLLQVSFNYKEQGMHTILGKSSIDSKGGDFVVSRIGLAQEVDLLIPPTLNLKEEFKRRTAEMAAEGKPVAAIIIDEAQFLTRKQVDQLMWVAVNLGVPVLAYGLRTDYQTNSFPGSQRLLEIAHTLEEIKNVCACGRKATLNARKDSHGEWVREGSQVAIDGEAVTYESLCAKCFMEKVHDFSE